ncbi:hypothetical protein LP420_31360 [Massilia sp. B-10]|nr:hypothetical protein LP420_31360 [Massilia sp. B-10]
MVGGSLSAVAASGAVAIVSVQVVGESVLIVLEGASHAARTTIRLSGQAAASSLLVTGAAVSMVTIASGTVLIVVSMKRSPSCPRKSGALVHHSYHHRQGY